MTCHNNNLKTRMRGIISQSEAARQMGVTFEHVNRVLNGHRESRRVLNWIEAKIRELGGQQPSE